MFNRALNRSRYIMGVVLAITLFAGCSSSGNSRVVVNNNTSANTNNTNSQTSVQQWKSYGDSKYFSLSYPANWVPSAQHNTYGHVFQNDPNSWYFLTALPPEANGLKKSFILAIELMENEHRADCHAWLQEERDREKTELMKGGGVTDKDATEYLRVRFEPTKDSTIAGYAACEPPHINTTEYYEEYYVIAWKDRVYRIHFPTSDSPSAVILDPLGNNVLAHQILNSLKLQ